MSDTQELIKEYVKKKQTHDQQEEVIRKSTHLKLFRKVLTQG